MKSFAHLVSYVRADEDDDLGAAQPITFASMRDARANAREVATVELLAAGFAEDGPPPEGFHALRLARSVLDLRRFDLPRRLPLIGDLLALLAGTTDAEWLIYTNVDIGLSAPFYREVARLADELDAFSINRRTVSADPAQARDLAWLRAQAGKPHGGHDCFVFRRALVSELDLGAVCIGFPPVGQLLLAVLSTMTERFRVQDQLHLTFHINDGRGWCDRRYDDYFAHNCAEALGALERLARKRPLSPFAERTRATIARYRGFDAWRSE